MPHALLLSARVFGRRSNKGRIEPCQSTGEFGRHGTTFLKVEGRIFSRGYTRFICQRWPKDPAIFGQGIVGLLTTALLARYPLTELITFDQHALRRKASLSLGASQSMDPREISAADFKDFDLMYELSG
ncbi:MAG: hypothetical protein HOE85_09265, partial [Nitrospinaceae bacterium]|nr:hypothetical protein [Nitrospinaceae bacterium]